MISLVPRPLFAGLVAALAFAGPAAADPLIVTTSETDSGEPFYSLVIVSPADGAAFEGTPDAVVPVDIEFVGFDGVMIGLKVDDVAVPADCADQFGTCTVMVTLAPGIHTLVATGNAGEQFPGVPIGASDPVTVEVTTSGETTDATTGSSSGEPTSGASGSSGGSGGETDTAGSSGGATTDGGATDGSSGSGGGEGGDKGCACAASPGAPDLFALALAALALPWRRRRAR